MPDPQPAVAPPVAPVVTDTTKSPEDTGAAAPPAQARAAHPAESPADDQRTRTAAPPASANEPSTVFNTSGPILPPVIGPYQVLGVLGEGGMGTVYRVRHLLMDREFALKVIRNEYYDSQLARERFVREIRNAFKISSDYVVRCSFADYHDRAPYLVMERLEGDTLFKWASAAPGRRTVADALRLGADLFRGLAAIHDAGLVHRDIKPGNLWVDRATGQLKVFDLGLARRYDADDTVTLGAGAPGAPPPPVGTPPYMAPEQANGERLDGRADLFAAGVVLYWFFTGTSPFASANRDRSARHEEELRAVREYDPPPLSAKNPVVPPDLSALVQQLLSKTPSDRPESARAALARLEALTARLNTPREAEGLVGRGDLLAAAGKALAAGGVVGLSGEGGMGKTFVAQALVRAHRAGGGPDVWIDCAAAPRFEGVVRETAAQLFAERSDTEPLEALAPRVAAHAVARAVLLVLDNFEQVVGDPDLCAWLRKFRAPARALVVGRSIPVDLPDALFPVTELDPASAADLFRARAKAAGLTADPPADVLGRLCAAVGYHPLALELLAKRACRVPLDALLNSVLEGLVPVGGTARGGRHASVRACFAESLKGLSPAAREHLLALSVLPAPFSPKMMTVVVGFDDGCAAAEELVGASLWRAGGTRYVVHPLVRRVAREELGDRRAEYELRAAARVATHMRAVREELRANGDAAVTKMYMGRCEVELPNLLALAATGPGPAVEIAEALSAFWGARGHWDAAERLYTAAADAARALNDPAREAWCREFRGYILRHLGRYDEADRMYRAALDLCARHPAANERYFARIVTRYGKLCAVRGRYDDALAHLSAGLERFRAAGDAEGALNALTHMGQACRFQGDLARAVALYTEALACDRKSAHAEGEARLQLGKTYLQMGRLVEATAQFRRSLRIAREADDGVRESLVLVDLGIVAEQSGDWAEAERLFTSGLQIAREMGLRMFEGRALRRTAEFFLARKAAGDAALALEYATAALTILADSEDAWAADRARETLARARGVR